MKTKKIVSILAVCALMLTLFSALPALAATNHLTDSIGFEGDSYTSASTFDGWNINSTNSSKVSAEVTEEKAYSGSKSLEVTVLDANGGQINYTGSQTLVAGTEYKVSMMVCIPSALGDGASTGGIQIRTDYVEGGSSSTESKYFGGPAYYNTGDAWQEISGTFVATENTTVAFRFRSGAPVNSIFYVDDITVYSTEELEAEAIELATKKFSYVSEYALVSDMESDFDKWETSAGTLATDANSHTKNFALKTTFSESASAQVKYKGTKPTVEAGKEYEASIWVNIPADVTTVSNFRLFLELPTIGTARKYANKYGDITTTNGTWKRLAFTFTPEEGGSGEIKTIRFEITTTGAATLYWDDMTIVEKEAQFSVLQILDENSFDVETPGAGAFTVKYDFHKANATNAGKTLIAGIYKDTDAGKQLVEVKMVTAGAADTAVTIPMTGIENPDKSYSLKVMYWDSLAGMFGYRTAEFAF